MTRRRTFHVEALESRSLLTAVATPAVAIFAPSPSHSNLSVRLTTDRSFYFSGQTVSMTLTETNKGRTPVTVTYGPSDDGFTVSQYGRTVWVSNPGAQTTFLENRTLKPGQSLKFHATWNGQPNVGPPGRTLGTFQVASELNGASPVTIQIENRFVPLGG